ncbi:hypothetical protein [Geodermatophilus sp. URMC 64]
MDTRTTTSGRARRARRLPPAAVRRPGLYLGVATAGALMVNVLFGADPAAQAEAGTSESVSVAQELGLSAQSGAVAPAEDLQPLEDLAASRSTREAEQTAAQQAQAAADQAELDRQKAEAEAKARAEAEAKAKAAAEAQAQARAAAAPAIAPEPAQEVAGTAVTATAHISNTAGSVKPQVQAAANAVVSNVPGAGDITLGGTRPSATDPHGHPSGLALDYMVLSDTALGNAIVQYHIDHWDELGVEYLIYRQRILQSPGGSWEGMSDRGSATANHMDHVHVNYR